MKVSDAVVEVACKAAAQEVGQRWPESFADADEFRRVVRAALNRALPMVVGEAVAEVREGSFGLRYIASPEWESLAGGTKLHTLTNLEDAP